MISLHMSAKLFNFFFDDVFQRLMCLLMGRELRATIAAHWDVGKQQSQDAEHHFTLTLLCLLSHFDSQAFRGPCLRNKRQRIVVRTVVLNLYADSLMCELNS